MGLLKKLFTNCAYSPEDLKKLLDEAGFTQTEIHRKKPTYATIIGVKA